MISRFHCPGLLATPGKTLMLPESAAHHATRVLRLRVGDALVVFDGAGRAWQGRIESAGREVAVCIDTELDSIPEPPLRITLVQSLPSGDKMDWVVQKAVELGVGAIQPVQAKRSVVRLTGDRAQKRIMHWQEVAASACEQCGRDTVPEVLPLLDLNQYFAQLRAPDEQRFLLAPTGGARLRELSPPAGTLTLLIGPEGGFEADEEAAAKVAGFAPLLLGPRVLRTETAGLAAIAAMMALWGDI